MKNKIGKYLINELKAKNRNKKVPDILNKLNSDYKFELDDWGWIQVYDKQGNHQDSFESFEDIIQSAMKSNGR